jgi:hypothetical protein
MPLQGVDRAVDAGDALSTVAGSDFPLREIFEIQISPSGPLGDEPPRIRRRIAISRQSTATDSPKSRASESAA